MGNAKRSQFGQVEIGDSGLGIRAKVGAGCQTNPIGGRGGLATETQRTPKLM